MEAIETVETDGEPNLVKQVTMTGYKLHDHLVRPAMVVVSKKAEEVKPAEEKETAETTEIKENVEKESDENIA